ncbi:trafficking protein particle complex subunit 2 [Thamnocephalis sphaerospora]|uniref:Trafficking protein particle complex subunit 2 n=1 Tax=Thamnocephalis sphaerospora TaxID=78915 RepID=A0A4P9XU29_9FUNG|nr:trafficking protein particle complex subunit 2 [Thamnocephalis sphaerospora]|eukprot:RKP09715.1 trafficking protein particle complex subunit 2 [Thamnocephalis sphaerospora]
MSYYFVIVGTKDNPVYEAELGVPVGRSDAQLGKRHLNQFVAHSSLDVIEEMMWSTNALYLKTVDRYNDKTVSGYVTPSNVKLLLIHENKADDGVKNFLTECHELYIKVLLSPFYEPNMPIRSVAFDNKIRMAARRYL